MVLFPAPAGPSIAILLLIAVPRSFYILIIFLCFDAASGKKAGRPCNLQIVSAGHRIHIEYLTAEVQILHPLGLHRGRINVLYRHAAPRDDCLIPAPSTRNGQRQLLDKLREGPSFPKV